MKRYALPLVLIVTGTWLLTGCFYLPTGEHPTSGNKDLRDLVGDARSSKPIRVGAISRAQVKALLGTPQFASSDERAIGYWMSTDEGVWVYPLCFYTERAAGRSYLLRLDFDSHDLLQRWQLEHQKRAEYSIIDHGHWRGGAIGRVNTTEPELVPLNGPAPTTRGTLKPLTQPASGRP